MNTSTDGEWMRVEDALAFLGMSRADAIEAICSRAYNGLIKAKAKQYIDGTGRRFGNVELRPEFWWSAREIDGNWRTGDLTTTSPDSPARLQAFGVTFRSLDIEQMISPAPQGASGASLSATQTRAGSKVTTPADGEWMSAHEAIQFLELPHTGAASAICSRAYAGLIKTRAKLFISFGEEKTDAEVPREFWWAKGEAALEQNWVLGDFETWVTTIDRERGGRREGLQQAFGVTFRRGDIEQLKPAISATPTAAPSLARRPAKRTVFIGHGGRSSEWLKLEKFLRDRLHLSPDEFNSTAVAGRATSARLTEMLKQADFAFLIFTGDDEQATGEVYPRLNVVHEAGLFQGKLGFEKAIILLEDGCENFSNVHGLNHISFPKGRIDAAFEDVRRVLEREMESAQIKSEFQAQKAKTELVKLLLGKALTSGSHLIAEQNNKDDEQAKKDAETWVTQSHNLISAAYGGGEAALFLNDSGYTFFSSNGRIGNWIRGRMNRITELLPRADSLDVRADFDPAHFE